MVWSLSESWTSDIIRYFSAHLPREESLFDVENGKNTGSEEKYQLNSATHLHTLEFLRYVYKDFVFPFREVFFIVFPES